MMERRGFLKLTTTTALAVAVAPSLITQKLYAEGGKSYKTYEKVLLKDEQGNPLNVKNIPKEENLIFNYPHAATPALLVNLATPTQKNVKLKDKDGNEYVFEGGVGPEGTIVAFSAICPHQFTYPTKTASMFNYVPEKGKTIAYEKPGVYVCTSHLSAFDPKEGGKKVAGPAEDHLAAIVLEVDKDGNLWAVGVLGPDRFQDFFEAFKQDLRKEYGRRGAKKLVKEEAKVQPLKNFTAEIIIA